MADWLDVASHPTSGWPTSKDDPLAKLRLSREERDHAAGHALDSIQVEAETLAGQVDDSPQGAEIFPRACSTTARRIAALSNLLGDIGWEREVAQDGGSGMPVPSWFLGELFPVVQLRPWLERWQRQDNEALVNAEEALKARQAALSGGGPRCEVQEDGRLRQRIADAQTKLGTGATLLARIKSGWPPMGIRYAHWKPGAEQEVREELETAWLQGFEACCEWAGGDRRAAATLYAERVVGGLTRPEGPEAA